MKKLLLVLLVVALGANLALAGDAAKPLTKSGQTALLFDLNGLAGLGAGNFEGGFGGKYYIANHFALRLGLGFTYNTQTDKNPATPPLPTNVLSESKRTTFSVTVAPGIQYNVVTSGPVVGYIGGQVSFTTNSDNRDGNSNGLGAGFTNSASYKVTGTTFGVALFIGAEWFAWDNISLAAEYRLGFSTTSGKTEQGFPAPTPGTSFDSPTVTNIGLGSASAANFTLAIYL